VFRIQGVGFRVQCVGFGIEPVKGSGFHCLAMRKRLRVKGRGCRVEGKGFRDHGFRVSGFGCLLQFMILGLGLRFRDSGYRI